MDSPLSSSLHLQAKACLALGSPFHAGLLDLAAEDCEARGPTAALLAPWKGEDLRGLMAAAVPLRLLGGLHDLVLSGDDPALAAISKQRSGRPVSWATVRKPPSRQTERRTSLVCGS